jgi:hypothetical protein
MGMGQGKRKGKETFILVGTLWRWKWTKVQRSSSRKGPALSTPPRDLTKGDDDDDELLLTTSHPTLSSRFLLSFPDLNLISQSLS